MIEKLLQLGWSQMMDLRKVFLLDQDKNPNDGTAVNPRSRNVQD